MCCLHGQKEAAHFLLTGIFSLFFCSSRVSFFLLPFSSHLKTIDSLHFFFLVRPFSFWGFLLGGIFNNYIFGWYVCACGFRPSGPPRPLLRQLSNRPAFSSWPRLQLKTKVKLARCTTPRLKNGVGGGVAV